MASFSIFVYSNRGEVIMKKLLLILVSLVSIILAISLQATVFADEESQSARSQAMEHKFEKAKDYYAECKHTSGEQFDAIRPYLKAFTDIEVMADMMADPAKFMKLIQVVNDPRVMHVMMKCSTEPVMWDTWMRGLSDPNKMMKAGIRFMNPMMYFNWAMAPMNPQTYAPMMSMMSPQYYVNWTNAMANPAFYSPFFSMMDPNWYTPRMQWMMNPASFAPMFQMMNYMQPVADTSDTE